MAIVAASPSMAIVAASPTGRRRVADSELSGAWYEKFWERCLPSGMSSLSATLGPFDGEVTPSALLRCIFVVEKFVVDEGCTSGVMHGARAEEGLARFLSSSPAMLAKGESSHLVAHKCVNHIMHLLRFCRYWHDENAIAHTARWKRRYPKTNSIRRRCSAAEVARIEAVASRIDEKPVLQVIKHMFDLI